MLISRRAALGAALAAAAAPPALAAPAPRAIRIGMSAPNTTLDPHLASNAPNNAVSSHIYDALVTNDEAARSRPGLALTWTALDDTHWELALRQDAVFSDGTPFTAADAIASLERADKADGSGSYRTYTRTIKAMTAPDPHVLHIETHAPDPMLANSLSRIRIISSRFKGAETGAFNNGTAAIGTGPFMLRDYVPGSRVTLVRNPHWWGPRLPWDDVTLVMATDSGGRLASLLAGDLDIVEQVPAEGADRLRNDARLHLVRGLSARLVFLSMDQARDVTPFITGHDGKPLNRNPLRDLRVRQALDHAINRAAIVDRVMSGDAIAAAQFLPKGGTGNAADINVTPYDPVRAKALLAEAGYPDGFRMVLHGPNNRVVNDSKIVQALAQMFTRIGIQTQPEVMPWAVYAPKTVAAEFSVFLGTWAANTGEASNPLTALVATHDRGRGMGAANEGRYSNPKLDSLLDRAVHTLDDTARTAMLSQASALVFHDAAVLPLHHEVSVWGARRALTYTTRLDQYTLAAGVGLA